MPKVSIIILTYNSSDYIGQLLISIKNSHKDNNDFEIIAVDNSSTDDTVSQIANLKSSTFAKASADKQITNLKLIENKDNLGFAAGINRGSKEANGECLLFLNPDSVFEKGNINDLVSVFEKFEKVGIVGGKLIDKNGKAEKSAGRFFGLFEFFLMTLGLDELFGIRFSPNQTTRVDFVSGGFMMIRKDLFEKLNGFDENFFMYVEDADFCKRAAKVGYQTYFTPEAELIHVSHGSSNRSFAIENIYKGLIYYSKKHGNLVSAGLVKLMLRLKARLLVFIGAILNNSYLVDTYGKVLKI